MSMVKSNIPISNSSQKKLKAHEKRTSELSARHQNTQVDSRGYSSANLKSSTTNKSTEDVQNTNNRNHEKIRIKDYTVAASQSS